MKTTPECLKACDKDGASLAANEQKPKKQTSIGHNESSSYMSSADKKANQAVHLKN